MKKQLKPRKSAIQARSQATVESILESATHILAHEEPDELSTNKIASRAGVSIGSLYQYFPGKEAILRELTRRLIDGKLRKIEENLKELVDSNLGPEEMIDGFVDFIVELKVKNLKFERALVATLSRMGDFGLSKWLDEQVIAKIASVLEPLKERGAVMDPEWAIFILFHTLRGVIISTSMQRPGKLKDPAFKREMAKLVKGYLLPASREMIPS